MHETVKTHIKAKIMRKKTTESCYKDINRKQANKSIEVYGRMYHQEENDIKKAIGILEKYFI